MECPHPRRAWVAFPSLLPAHSNLMSVQVANLLENINLFDKFCKGDAPDARVRKSGHVKCVSRTIGVMGELWRGGRKG